MGAYVGALTLTGVLYWLFTPAGADACGFNITVITLTLLLCLSFSLLSLHPVVRPPAHHPSCC